MSGTLIVSKLIGGDLLWQESLGLQKESEITQ